MRRALLTAAKGITLPAIGDAFMGGYYAGIIDTTKGNIIAADASQAGLRYALIVAPSSLESASLQYKNANTAAPAAAQTRWDGLGASAAMATASYPAANYCYGLTPPADAASRWYLPAMDELELIFRSLKSTTTTNATTTRAAGTFPGVSAGNGENVSSDPAGAAYTSNDPAQTAVLAFRAGGGQELGVAGANVDFWSSTENTATSSRSQMFSASVSNANGQQLIDSKTILKRVRPVRRLLL